MLKTFSDNALRYISHFAVSQFFPPAFYHYMGSRTLKKNFLGILLVLMLNMILVGVLTVPAASLFVLTVLLTTSPYVFLSSVFDPFVAWLRGETEKPWAMLWRNVAIHTWPIANALLLTSTGLLAYILFGGALEVRSAEDSSFTNLAYMSFITVLGLHQVVALMRTPNVRKAQMYVSGIVFVMVFLSVPVSTLFLT